MKTEASNAGPCVSQAVAKGTCPICAILKDLQSKLAETAGAQADVRLCNLHGWTLARSRGKLSRSTLGEGVTNILLEMLKGPLVGKVNREACRLCHHVLEEEVARLRELAHMLQGSMFAQWMRAQGTLWLEHARKVKGFVPLRLRALVDEIVERNRAELERELEAFREQRNTGFMKAADCLVAPLSFWLVNEDSSPGGKCAHTRAG